MLQTLIKRNDQLNGQNIIYEKAQLSKLVEIQDLKQEINDSKNREKDLIQNLEKLNLTSKTKESDLQKIIEGLNS